MRRGSCLRVVEEVGLRAGRSADVAGCSARGWLAGQVSGLPMSRRMLVLARPARRCPRAFERREAPRVAEVDPDAVKTGLLQPGDPVLRGQPSLRRFAWLRGASSGPRPGDSCRTSRAVRRCLVLLQRPLGAKGLVTLLTPDGFSGRASELAGIAKEQCSHGWAMVAALDISGELGVQEHDTPLPDTVTIW